MLTFMHKLHKVAAEIMTCIAIGLGLPEDFFTMVRQPFRRYFPPAFHTVHCSYCLPATGIVLDSQLSSFV